MSGVDRAVVVGVGGVVLGLPLLQGGQSPLALAVGVPVVLTLLGVTIRERRRRGPTAVRGLLPLAAFLTLGLAATLPLPPALLSAVAPASSRLFATMLPGWPGEGWTPWRAVAIDPWRAWLEVARMGIAFAIFAVLVAFPWRSDDPERARSAAVESLVVVILAGGLLLAASSFVAQAATDHSVTMAALGLRRGAGPFARSDDLAAWLGAVVPLAAAQLFVLGDRMTRRMFPAGLDAALQRGRLPVAAVIRAQRRLYGPILAAAGLIVLVVAHGTSGSPVGPVALLVGAAAMLRSAGTGRIARGAAVAALLLASGVLLAWGVAGSRPDGDPASLASRATVAWQSVGVARDAAPSGVGLGSWAVAYRPHQAPPIQGVAWDHAQNDWIELLVEGGVVGLALVAAFAWIVLRTPRVEAATVLRAGLVAGVVVILVHASLGAALRTPGTLVLLMAMLGLLVLTGAPPAAGRSPALGILAAALAVAVLPLAVDAGRVAIGRVPWAPERRLAAAAGLDRTERGQALALVRGAVDRAPASAVGQAALAALLPGPDGDAALARAVQLAPWSPDLRDRLALRLWAGALPAGPDELEESVARVPALGAHRVLAVVPRDDGFDMSQAAAGVAALDAPLADAVVRGLERARDGAPTPTRRAAILTELVAVHEARGDWSGAADVLRAEAVRDAAVPVDLGRAARDLLRAGRPADAEATLLEAVRRNPDEGGLYRTLAVDVYAARGEFDVAEQMLEAGERNARDMAPVYDGVAELLTRRETSRGLSARDR